MAAKSTTAGTPVKSCKITRPGLNGISTDPWCFCHAKILCTSSSKIYKSIKISFVSHTFKYVFYFFFLKWEILFIYLKIVTISDSTLQENSYRKWQFEKFIAKSCYIEKFDVFSTFRSFCSLQKVIKSCRHIDRSWLVLTTCINVTISRDFSSTDNKKWVEFSK